jgi:hypothetical protein
MRSSAVRPIAAITLCLLLMPLSGCRMSRTSSRSFASLASIWSLSASFRSSFGGRGAGLDEGYARDIAAVGAAFISSDEPEAALRNDVTHVATTHGITDWEVLEETWLGLGIGLRHAGLDEETTRDLVARVFGSPEAVMTVASVWTEEGRTQQGGTD